MKKITQKEWEKRNLFCLINFNNTLIPFDEK